jgi:hypothetical protein
MCANGASYGIYSDFHYTASWQVAAKPLPRMLCAARLQAKAIASGIYSM